MMDYEEWGSTGRQGVNQAAEGGPWAIAGTSPPGGRAGQIRMVSPGGWHRGVWDAQLYLKLLRGAWL